MQTKEPEVRSYYQATVGHYADQYGPSWRGYPANLKRLELLIRRARELKIRTLLDCGCGEGTPIRRLHEEAGVDVWGFDFSEKMAQAAGVQLEGKGLKNRVWPGDITQPASFRPAGVERPEAFDACLAAGVFPHLRDPEEGNALRNMAAAVRTGGRVFAEFRNELFSLFTLNRYSHEFLCKKLIGTDRLAAAYPQERQKIEKLAADLEGSFRMDMPAARPRPDGSPLSIDEVLCRFKNPFECPALFSEAGLRVEKFHFYHFHALPPFLEEKAPGLFRAASLEMEKDPSDWRGYFMASAFVVEAVRS